MSTPDQIIMAMSEAIRECRPFTVLTWRDGCAIFHIALHAQKLAGIEQSRPVTRYRML